MKIVCGLYGLQQAGLTNQLLEKHIKEHDYYEVVHMPGLFTHIIRPT